MKKVLKYIGIGFGSLILLIILIAVFSGGDSSNTADDQAPDQEQTQEAMAITTSTFISEFDDNQLAAEQKYQDKRIEFTAKIDNISEDILGTPFLSLVPTNAGSSYFGTSIKCEFGDKSELTSFKNGQTVKLQGTVDSQSIGIISVKKCGVV